MSESKKTGYILGSLLIISGIILWITLGVMDLVALLIICGFAMILFQRHLNRITGTRIKAEPQNPKRQIVITVSDDGNTEVVAEGILFHDAIAILEVSKYQLISQYTRGGSNPMQIIKRP